MSEFEELREPLLQYYDADGYVRGLPCEELDAVLRGYAATREVAREAMTKRASKLRVLASRFTM